jgi:hypothetical protein
MQFQLHGYLLLVIHIKVAPIYMFSKMHRFKLTSFNMNAPYCILYYCFWLSGLTLVGQQPCYYMYCIWRGTYIDQPLQIDIHILLGRYILTHIAEYSRYSHVGASKYVASFYF